MTTAKTTVKANPNTTQLNALSKPKSSTSRTTLVYSWNDATSSSEKTQSSAASRLQCSASRPPARLWSAAVTPSSSAPASRTSDDNQVGIESGRRACRARSGKDVVNTVVAGTIKK